MIEEDFAAFFVWHAKALEESRYRARKAFPKSEAKSKFSSLRNCEFTYERNVAVLGLIELEFHGVIL